METKRTEYLAIGKNHVEKRVFAKLVDGSEIEIEQEKESFGDVRYKERKDNLEKRLIDWQNLDLEKHRQEQIDNLNEKLAELEIIKTKLEEAK